MSIQVCRDSSDAVVLYLPQRLYLKSFAKLNISVQLPVHKVYGKSISNWELTEKLRKMILPDSFSVLKVSKHSSEVIRFDAELENCGKLERVLARLDNRIVQLNDYPEQLKVKVSEAKSDFPSRHMWDSYFRDATDMDEMKPGERPDTIHIRNLPISWFIYERDTNNDAVPTEAMFKKVFEKFGTIRQVDVPVSDPFRRQMKEAMRGITVPAVVSSVFFEGYLQFSEYVGFVRCMDALRGRKLLKKKDDISEWCDIDVDFDRTKHMTDAAVKRRAIVRERLIARQRAKDEEEKMEKDKVAKREANERNKLELAEREKLSKMREREERRKKKRLAKLVKKDNMDVNKKVAEEEKKLVLAQKKLQAIRLIEELFKRIELRPELQRHGNHERYYERSTRSRIVDRYKRNQEQKLEEQRELVKQAHDGRIVIRSALETKKPRQVSPISSLSSEDERTKKRIKTEKLSTPDREFNYKPPVPGMYPYGFPYPFPCAPPPGYPFAQTSLYYPVRGYFGERRGVRGRGRGRGSRPRMPYFDGPDASHQYYQYFKKLTEQEGRNYCDRSHSRRRSYSRSHSRSRSRSRRRSYSRSRSRTKRSRSRRSRSRRSRSRSKRSSSRSRRSKSSNSRSRSRKRSRSRSRRSRTKSRSRSRPRTPSDKRRHQQDDKENGKQLATPGGTHERSKSWSMPRDGTPPRSWSKSPKNRKDAY